MSCIATPLNPEPGIVNGLMEWVQTKPVGAAFRARNANEHIPYQRRTNRGKRTHP